MSRRAGMRLLMRVRLVSEHFRTNVRARSDMTRIAVLILGLMLAASARPTPDTALIAGAVLATLTAAAPMPASTPTVWNAATATPRPPTATVKPTFTATRVPTNASTQTFTPLPSYTPTVPPMPTATPTVPLTPAPRLELQCEPTRRAWNRLCRCGESRGWSRAGDYGAESKQRVVSTLRWIVGVCPVGRSRTDSERGQADSAYSKGSVASAGSGTGRLGEICRS